MCGQSIKLGTVTARAPTMGATPGYGNDLREMAGNCVPTRDQDGFVAIRLHSFAFRGITLNPI